MTWGIQFKDILAATITLGFFWLLYMLLSANVPVSTRDILLAMTGVCGAAFGSVVGYYYGSSSNRKSPGESAPTLVSNQVKKEAPVNSQDLETP